MIFITEPDNDLTGRYNMELILMKDDYYSSPLIDTPTNNLD